MEELFNIAVFEAAIFAVHATIVALAAGFVVNAIGVACRKYILFKAKCSKEVNRCEPKWPTV